MGRGRWWEVCGKCGKVGGTMWEIWGGLGRSGEVWGGPGRSGEIWGDPGRSGEVRGDPGISGEIRGDPGRSGEMPHLLEGERELLHVEHKHMQHHHSAGPPKALRVQYQVVGVPQ